MNQAKPWHDDGRALILDQAEGRLVVAEERPGFRRVERYNEPQIRGVLPGGNWKLRKKNAASRIGSPVIAFLVYVYVYVYDYDTHVRPFTRLPSLNGRWKITSARYDLFQSD